MRFEDSIFQELYELGNVPVFLHPEYLDFILGTNNWSYTTEELNGVKGIYFYHHKSILGLKYLTMHPMVKYMGPYFSSIEDTFTCNQLARKMYSSIPNNNFVVQQWHPDRMKDCYDFLKSFHTEEKKTYQLDLTKPQEILLENFASNNRRAIVKYSEEYQSIYSPQNAYDLIVGVLPEPKSLGIDQVKFLEFVKFIERNKIGRHKVWTYKNEPVAANVVLFDQENTYYLMAGNKRISGSTYPGLQAVWQTILEIKAKGIKNIDFLGSSIPSIAAFWERLGAEQTIYPYFKSVPNPLFKAIMTVRRWI